MQSMFSKKDIGQIEAHGLTLEAIERQLEVFRRGFPFLAIVSAASVGDGIIRMDDRGR